MTEQEKETNDIKIEYYQSGKDLRFIYLEEYDYFPDQVGRLRSTLRTGGIIPDEIIAQGIEAVKKFASEEALESINNQKEELRISGEKEKNMNYPVQTVYGDILLRGRIVSVYCGDLVVDLEEPFKGTEQLHFGVASAVAGRSIFRRDNSHQFSETALIRAREMLIKAYQKGLRGETDNRVNDLINRLSIEGGEGK